MALFRVGLITFWIILFIYTVIVISNHGMGLIPIFFGDMGELTWPGQFNLDFFGFLLLSGLWTAWRHRFSFSGLALGLVAIIGGIGFLAPYLLYLSFKTGGDAEAILLGAQRREV